MPRNTRNLAIHLMEHGVSCQRTRSSRLFRQGIKVLSDGRKRAAGGRMNSREPGANYWLLGANLKAPLLSLVVVDRIHDRAHPRAHFLSLRFPILLSRSKTTEELERATFDTFAA